MKRFEWDNEKNKYLKKTRNISFEDIEYYITKGDILDVVLNPNQSKYPEQKILIIKILDYVYSQMK